MKPNELFIGALARTPLGEKGWVRSIHYVTKEDGHGGYYLITLAFDKDGESYTKICEKDVRPIPLTPEILEKNGWRYNDMPFVQGWEQCGLTIVNNRISCGKNVSMKVEYVHQLQFALKLCGIEKEIVL